MVGNIGKAFGTVRFNTEQQANFLRTPITLPVIAERTAADQVVPVIGTTTYTGNNMVDGQRQMRGAAIGAAIAISGEDTLARWSQHRHGTANEVIQAHYRRSITMLHDMRLAQIQKDESSLSIRDIQRLVVVIQHQNFVRHSLPFLSNRVLTGRIKKYPRYAKVTRA